MKLTDYGHTWQTDLGCWDKSATWPLGGKIPLTNVTGNQYDEVNDCTVLCEWGKCGKTEKSRGEWETSALNQWKSQSAWLVMSTTPGNYEKPGNTHTTWTFSFVSVVIQSVGACLIPSCSSTTNPPMDRGWRKTQKKGSLWVTALINFSVWSHKKPGLGVKTKWDRKS